jgi:hypothetical protein
MRQYHSRVDAWHEWRMADKKALNVIALHVDRDNAALLHDITSGKEAWITLKSYHLAESLANKIRVSKKLFSLKLERGGNVRKHLGEMQKLFNKLSDINKPVKDEDKMALMLASVGSEYEALVTAIEAWPVERLTMAAISERLIQEYEKKAEARGSHSSLAQSSSSLAQSSSSSAQESAPRGLATSNRSSTFNRW